MGLLVSAQTGRHPYRLALLAFAIAIVYPYYILDPPLPLLSTIRAVGSLID